MILLIAAIILIFSFFVLFYAGRVNDDTKRMMAEIKRDLEETKRLSDKGAAHD